MRGYVFHHWRVAVSAAIIVLAVVAFTLVSVAGVAAGGDPCCKFTANCEGGYWGHTCYLQSQGCSRGFDDELCSEIPDP